MKTPSFLNILLFLISSAWAASAWAADKVEPGHPPAEAYFRAIRAHDLTALKSLCKQGVAGVKDRLDYTPLHYAALYGSTESLRIVLEAGADVNARNSSQATPLLYAAYSLEKTRLLVEKGADVNAKADDGSTALWVASAVPGNENTVRYLVDKGAQPLSIRPNGVDYLMRAAQHHDVSGVQYLLDNKLDPHRVTPGGNALSDSLVCDGGAKAKLLIAAGSDVNAFNTNAGRVKNGPIEATGETPLMLAAACAESGTAAELLKAGANINALDVRHMTALMRAVATDHANPETVSLLIARGADLNVADRNRETALDWARKFNNPAIVALLEKAGAKANGLAPAPVRPADYKPTPKEAIDRASALLAKSSETFFREGGGCVGCHHQPFAGRAFGAVRAAGLTPEPRLRQILVGGMVAELPRDRTRLVLMNAGGGGYASFLYPLAGMADMGEPASEVTDVMVHYIAVNQDVDGSWSSPGSRPPLQESAITQTMLAVYALKTYGWAARNAEFSQRIEHARNWLLTAPAISTVDEADRLMGLWLAGAGPAALLKTSQTLLAQQRSDGGWAQTAYLESDAFGTAAALYSLRKTGFLNAGDPVYRRGADWLLNHQFPDGSWYVRSRVVKLQPYFQSAFPYDHDQWISNSATGYAVIALAPVAAASYSAASLSPKQAPRN
jgi:ankyrin repeat protein